MRKTYWLAILAFLVGGSVVAEAAYIELYNDGPPSGQFQTGLPADGSRRSEHFSPTQSTPGSLTGTGAQEKFDKIAVWIGFAFPDSVTLDLQLYPWVTNYTTSLGQPMIAHTGNVTKVGSSTPTGSWLELTLPTPLAASGQYLMSTLVVAHSYAANSTGWGLGKSNTSDGGTNNDAFNNTNNTVLTDREYRIRLNAMPEPATLLLLGLAAPVMLRRRSA